MTSRRESLFPPTSIGRAHGASIVRSGSRESLAAHPLLSPGPSGSPSQSPSPTPDSAAHASNQKYVPYTPRQRPATTGSTAQPPVSASPQQPQSQGGATSKLQLMNLKAAAQGIGLDTGCLGWAMLEKISYEGKFPKFASLLLPLEQSSGNEKITPELVQDHIIICDTASRDDTAVITLSGLRGQLVNDVLTFRSTLSPATKQFQDLLASSRASLLAALPPLPFYPPESSYPTFTLPAYSESLPLPPRASKPPLPPRPNARPTPAQTSSRLSMPFASLFGQRPATPPTTATPLPPPPAPAPAPASTETEHTIEISAFSIGAAISRRDVSREIVGALKAEIAVSLNDQPPWVVERVQSFALPFFPFVKAPAGKKKLHDIGGSPNRITYAVNAAQDAPDDLSEKFQDFYSALEAELRNSGGTAAEKSKEDLDVDNARGNERREEEKEENDARIRDVLETVENTVCTLFYDRLFLPFTSDDASHDEALSSRIAALNMLDLGLEHLDVDVGGASREDLDAVVHACGETLAQLDLASWSPRDKATVLVSAHKLVVEGLSKVPPLRLKSSDSRAPATPPPAPIAAANDSGSPSRVVVSSPVDIPTLMSSDTREDMTHTSLSPVQLSISPESTSVPRATSPLPDIVAQPTSTPVSGDVLLPVIIFSVVKANPARLVSHLLFTQRFRNQTFGGEESYCLINLMAVAEFLENVDLGALGLGESENKVISTADLTPIPIVRSHMTPESPIGALDDVSGSLRGRVEQGVDAITGSANKVISGVVDSSFGVLRAFLPGQGGSAAAAAPVVGSVESGESSMWGVRPGLGLLRRESGFSIANLTASLPGQGPKAKSVGNAEEAGQRELVEVSSRPASLKSSGNDEEAATESEDTDSSSESEEGGEEEDGEVHDTRSIKSFESMMSGGKTKRKGREVSGRQSLTDRLTHMSGLSRRSQSDATKANSPKGRQSLLLPQAGRVDILPSSRTPSPVLSTRLPPPNRRFLECTEQDLKVSEVGELLREYQRLVEGVRSMGGFSE
ncbi:hypothetical protein HYDPIDRAFT_28009 [Hydnomerulius pinastri MD-312]|uniref:VPS9 domain-containing protein n=1 Tax=Hydnomerulius pinastri MD-312 TaxID=994086 RepID=A0A0C9VHZ9_9AGAM|nr:hypothetical protein HYDPIDRAFT_28009 [Hydnomerulius pinastri MD-312]